MHFRAGGLLGSYPITVIPTLNGHILSDTVTHTVFL